MTDNQVDPDLRADFELMAKMEAGQPDPQEVKGQLFAETTPNRRGFFGKFARAGAVVVGGIAGLSLTRGGEAEATPCYRYGCCCLAKPPGGCPGSGTGYSCPSGWYRRYWTCVVNGIGYYCGECQSRAQHCTDKSNGNTYLCSEYQRFG